MARLKLGRSRKQYVFEPLPIKPRVTKIQVNQLGLATGKVVRVRRGSRIQIPVRYVE